MDFCVFEWKEEFTVVAFHAQEPPAFTDDARVNVVQEELGNGGEGRSKFLAVNSLEIIERIDVNFFDEIKSSLQLVE